MRHRTTLLVLSALTCSCRPRPEQGSPPEPALSAPAASAPSAPPAPSLASAEPPPATSLPSPASALPSPASPLPVVSGPVEVQACAGRKGCKLIERKPAGRGEGGKRLEVLKVALPDGSGELTRPEPEDTNADACRPCEYWLSAGGQARQLLPFEPVVDPEKACFSGMFVGKAVTLGDNRVAYLTDRGMGWRTASTLAVRLDPPTLVSTEETRYFAGGPNPQSLTVGFRFAEFRGEVRWRATCGRPAGEPEAKAPERRAVAVPLVALDGAFERDWKVFPLGTCSARVDASSAGGLVLEGPRGGKDDGSLRVVASGRSLYVDAIDDAWTAADQIEIVTSPDTHPGQTCMLGLSLDPPRRWALSPLDGRLLAQPPGEPRASIEHRPPDGPGRPARFKITFEPPEGQHDDPEPGTPPHLSAAPYSITVVFRDSDEGGKVERVIATSPYRQGEADTLGQLVAIHPSHARCAVRQGQLEPEITYRPAPGSPLLRECP